MGEYTHRIRRQVIEIEIADEGDAKSLQDRISTLHRQRIVQAIERACDAIAGGPALVRLDRLTIDLGELSADELEETLVERLSGTLEASLRRLVQEAEAGSQPGSQAAHRVEDVQATLEELTLFVRTGAMPWSTGDRDCDYFQRRAQALHTASPGALAGLVRGLAAAGERQSLARLVAHLDDHLLCDIATRALAPARVQTLACTGSVTNVVADLVNLLGAPGALAGRSPRARRNLAWSNLLWLSERSSKPLTPQLEAVELYTMVLEAVRATVGRTLPGATKLLQQRSAEAQTPGIENASPSRAAVKEAAELAPENTPEVGTTHLDAQPSTNNVNSPRVALQSREDATHEPTERRRFDTGDGKSGLKEAGTKVTGEALGRPPRTGATHPASRSEPKDENLDARTGATGATNPASSREPKDGKPDALGNPPRTGATGATNNASSLESKDGKPDALGRPPRTGATGATNHASSREPKDETSDALGRPSRKGATGASNHASSRVPKGKDLDALGRPPRTSTTGDTNHASSREPKNENLEALRDNRDAPSVQEQENFETGERAALTGEAAAAVEAWLGAAEDAVAVLGAGPPGAEGRRRLERLISTLVTLAQLVAHLPEVELHPRLLRAVDPTTSRRNLEFSLMALVGGAASRLARDEAMNLRRGLETLLARAKKMASEGRPSEVVSPEELARTHAVHPRRSNETTAVTSEPGKAKTASKSKSKSNTRVRSERNVGTVDNTAHRRRVPPPALPRLTDLSEEALYIGDAGMVLLAPFIPHFFRHLGLADERGFISDEAHIRAAALLRVAVTGESQVADYQLPLAKVLSGLPIDALVELDPKASHEEEAEARAMLEAVILRAPILKKMSVAGLRGSFLLRPGVLRVRDGTWLLQVERQSYDVVVDRFPWSFLWVKLPWMHEPLQVEW